MVLRESDIAPPITAYLIAQGYTVRSEVKGCDITATRGEELVVVELKRNFSTDLLIQAIERQRIADSVYVAVPARGELARTGRYNPRRNGIQNLLKRLELGLILVHLPDDPDSPIVPSVEVVLHPIQAVKPRRKPRVRRALLREIAERKSGDYNVGGSNKKSLMTAYREQCIFIACCLDRYGPQSPAALRRRGATQKTQSILGKNVYGWFEKLDRGVYALRAEVRAHIAATYPGTAAHYEQILEEVSISLPELE